MALVIHFRCLTKEVFAQMHIVMRHLTLLLTGLLSIGCLAQSARTASTNRSTAARANLAKSQVKVVAGVVEQGGTVRYLPRVEVRVFPQKYADAERNATAAYTADLERLRQIRDSKYKDITDRRRAELKEQEDRYNQQLQTLLASFRFDAVDGIPSCADYDSILHQTQICATYSTGRKMQLSSQLRKWMAHPALIGTFDPQTFRADKTPYSRDQRAALLAIPLNVYEQVPEFQTQVQKAEQKERSQAHVATGATMPEDAQHAAVTRFLNEWAVAAGKQNYFGRDDLTKFGSLTFDFVSTGHKELEKSAQAALRKNTDQALLAYIRAKDEINSKYDSQQAAADAEFQSGAKAAEEHRASILQAAAKATPPLATATTSLQGDTIFSLAAGSYALYAEDTTTDHHYRWTVPIAVRSQSQTIELTDANALKATAETVASASAQPSYPKASELNATQKAEYDLRYGSRLLGSWNRICSSIGTRSHAEERLLLNDSPLGFGFVVMCTSDSVFNTLRMNDNDVAARTFRDYVATYLRALPSDLKGTGGSQVFETVSVEVLTSSKSFADEYAVAHSFWLNYVFRLADVESFAAQKIDAQQLLDRAHITNDQIGRITVKLVGAN
jgi:hypothetical protein